MTDHPLRQADETLDDLKRDGLHVLQKRSGFRFGMDAVLLADFAVASPQDAVADFGTGSAVIPLLMASRGKGSRFDAFESDPDIADMAARSVQLNGMADRIRVHACRAEDAVASLGKNAMDVVVSNPPYWSHAASTGAIPSRVQTADGLGGWLSAAYAVLRGKGRLCMVYAAPRCLQLLSQLEAADLMPKRIRLVHHEASRQASLILIEAVKSAHAGLEVQPPLILYHDSGQPTAEYLRIYREEGSA